MTTYSNEKCADDTELLRLVDGELSVNETARLRAHAITCVHCAHSLRALDALVTDVKARPAGVGGIDDVAMVAALMRRIDRASTIPRTSAPRPKRVIAFAAASFLVAAAAAIAIVPRPHDNEGTFAARGQETPLSLRQAVSVTFTTPARPPRNLQNGAILGKTELLGASYSNARPAAPTFLMAFAIDSANTVHWLYPAYEEAGTDPESVTLVASDRPKAMPTSVLLDAPAEGPMRLVSLVSETPHHVSEIESLPAADTTATELRARFPDAVIDETSVVLSAAQSPSSQ